jgi:hypothetical protein
MIRDVLGSGSWFLNLSRIPGTQKASGSRIRIRNNWNKQRRNSSHLELDCFEEYEERGAGVVLHVVVEAERQPVGQHLLHDGLGAAQHQLRVLRAQGPLHQLQQQASEPHTLIIYTKQTGAVAGSIQTGEQKMPTRQAR